MKNGIRWKSYYSNGDNRTKLPHTSCPPLSTESKFGANENYQTPTHHIPSLVSITLSNQSKTGCLQSPMALLSNDCYEIQNQFLQSLGTKTMGQIFMSLIIRNMWDTAWDVCNNRNHTLNSPNGPTKTKIIKFIMERITYHYNIGTTVLPQRCHFLSHTTIHALLYCPVRHKISWIVEISSLQASYQVRSTKGGLDTYQIILSWISNGRLIPSLSQFEETPPLRKTYGADQQRTLFIEQGDEPNTEQISVPWPTTK